MKFPAIENGTKSIDVKAFHDQEFDPVVKFLDTVRPILFPQSDQIWHANRRGVFNELTSWQAKEVKLHVQTV